MGYTLIDGKWEYLFTVRQKKMYEEYYEGRTPLFTCLWFAEIAAIDDWRREQIECMNEIIRSRKQQ